MLASQLTTAKTKSRKPRVPASGGPRLQPRPGGVVGGGGARLSLLLPGSLLQFHPVPSARLGVRELRDLGDLISIHCREPTWKPRAGREALEGCSRRGNSSPGRPPPPPACRIQASQVPCSARPPRAKRLLIPLTCGKCKLRGKPWEIKPPERKPAPPTHKANTPHPAATQSPAHPGEKIKKMLLTALARLGNPRLSPFGWFVFKI